MRNPGTLMGVASDGSFQGSLSGGCVENAVVAEALEALAKNEPRVVRFGSGSPYLDIKLPCGGGLDVHFLPISGPGSLVKACLGSIAQRRPFSLTCFAGAVEHQGGWRSAKPLCDRNEGWSFGYWPAPQLKVIGHGAGVSALADLANAFGVAVQIYTSDDRIHASLTEKYVETQLLRRTSQTEVLVGDPWTAFVFLFHDHDWEIDLMAHALREPHFYLGAMGGRKAHAMRSEALSARGIAQQELDAFRAPIGVFHSSRDPQTLALSTLAEVIRTYQETDFEAALG